MLLLLLFVRRLLFIVCGGFYLLLLLYLIGLFLFWILLTCVIGLFFLLFLSLLCFIGLFFKCYYYCSSVFGCLCIVIILVIFTFVCFLLLSLLSLFSSGFYFYYYCCFCIGLFFNSDLRRTCIWRLRTSTRRSKKLWTLCRRACLSFFFFVIIGVIMYWVVIFIVVIVDILSWFVSFIGLLSTDTIVVICIGLLCINIIHVILYCDVPSYYYRFSFEWVVLYYNYCWYI